LPSARRERAASASRAGGHSRAVAALGDDADDSMRDLLDRELAHLDHRAAQPAVHLAGVLELVVDLDQARVLPVTAHPADALAADLGQSLRVARRADDLRLVDREKRRRWVDALDEGNVRGLVSEIAEVDRERRLGRARNAHEHDI